MFVFEIVTPGTWLDYDDRDWAWKIQNQLQSLESQFFEANAALNLFANAQAMRPSFADRENWERDSKRREEIQRAIEQERGGQQSRNDWDEIHFEAEVRFKREKWSSGGVPREFEHNLPFIYARAFLYALDAFDKFLGVLAEEENVPLRRFLIFAASAIRRNTSKIALVVWARAEILNPLISCQSTMHSSVRRAAVCSH